MIRSMTAFGRGEFILNDTVFTAEIKSVNTRYRDVVLHIPKNLQILEDEIRSRIITRVRRGRIEVTIQVKRNGVDSEYELELNKPMVSSYLKIFHQLKEEYGLDQNIKTDYLCQMKDVIIVKTPEWDLDKTRRGLEAVLIRALDSMDDMRCQEGRIIEEDLHERLNLIEGHLDFIEKRAPMVVQAYKGRLKDKINRISNDMELDENRLIQEVAIFADRCDITEEIVRARSHLKQFRDYLSPDDSVGRRLDFLSQEFHREFNTMGVKASDASISAKVVEVKAELEKIREQVQNVE
ncbi:MAG: YicC/YloC family endoribonuclease [Pseudomonadota bacterium]